MWYEYLGAKTDSDYTKAMAALNTIVTDMGDDVIVTSSSVDNYATQWDRAVNFMLEPITPTGYMRPVAGSYVGSLPSVLASRDACTACKAKSSAVGTLLKERAYDCARNAADPLHSCINMQLYQDMTGNVGAAQPDGTSISKAFRSAFLHIIAVPPGWAGARLDEFYALSSNSYFSESAYEMGKCEWKQRLWGDNYAKLLETKRKWDPTGVFWCRHCISDEE